ncbi:putative bifunctional diguanylate cyclase/phosphodiesterase [Pengzhenrongella frigida]|uniref:EAL domain-containing protein n=1 Tax=Pengzhenrongella frigida TaxID=1259133 RepID=A0A4Q5MZ06_9MICO|nr:EAL domain-containing protein [Cellulomonas sp. HLT2-17]RYV50945.1 EAL domain-containing protein [Cellulomonas sp. HLT2-17]
MVHEKRMASVLSDFARTLLTDFPIQAILDQLVERIPEVLPITGAGITVISPGLAPQYIAASNDEALRFERLQASLAEGPCLTAFRTGQAVFVPDLAADRRFPRFGPAAVAAGMAAVFTFPMRHGEARIGALDLYRDRPGALTAAAQDAAQTLADVAAAYLLNAQARQEATQAADWFRDRSLHDVLTGLPNRALLQERIEHASHRALRTHGAVAVLFVDLDHFKRVNDAYGHAVGDELLIAVGRRLASLVRPGDTLARVSGDEFVFLCEDLSHVTDVDVLVERIDEAFATPFALSGVEIAATASVGIAYAGAGEAVSDDLVLDADIAMYQAKRRGGATHQVINLRLAEEAHDRNELERDLRAALAGAALDVAYQPIVRSIDGSVIGVEALLRWTHPARGPVPAAAAVAVAEQSGLIAGIGGWVLDRACRDRGRWLAEHPRHPLDLSVNVSAHQLMAPGFVASVAEVLRATEMDPAALVLEVTEGVFVADGDRAMGVLGDLKLLGLRLALDDFGTGYSSLSYLRRFPVDIVKIDQSFVADLGRDPAASTMVAAITHLAHDLDKTVTAEGVETAAQRDEVVSVGCELAQGFFFARPMPALELSARLH